MTTRNRMQRFESELNAKLRKATRLLVFSLRMHTDNDDKIRQDIATAFNKALETDVARVAMVDCGKAGIQKMVSTDGMFAMVFGQFGLDRQNLTLQERWWAVVDAALDEAIADPFLGDVGHED